MKEESLIWDIVYWTRHLLSANRKAHTVKSWQVIQYLLELEQRHDNSRITQSGRAA